MTADEWEYATDDFKTLRKEPKMKPTQFKEYRNIIGEALTGKEVAKRMGKNKQLFGPKWIAAVKKMKTVTRDDLEKLLPDFISGGEITKVLEEVELAEKGTAYPATIDTLKMIVKDKQNQVVMFDKGQARVDTFTASAMVAVYDAMKKPDLKKKFETMIKSKDGFLKTQAFAMKMIK